MAASITKAGERLIAEKQAAQEVLEVVRFVLALVPGLDPDRPVDRDAPTPPSEQIVHTQAITQKGFVNPNQVVYSLMMGSDIGDFDWNWIGLETVENVLLSVGYVPVQQKRKNIPPHQIGNNVTRNMMLVFDGAQALTEVTIDASTWQHDFTVRLHDIDERERLSNRDVFGRACFFKDGLQLVKLEGAYHLKPGLAYLEGLRVKLDSALPVIPVAPPVKAWLDVALARQENSAAVGFKVEWGAERDDYIDNAGVQHYLIPLADLPDSSVITDLRTVEPIDGPLVHYFAERNGDYKHLRARGTTKEDVGLDQLPNAKSDDPETNSSEILATTAALNNLNQQINDSLAGMIAAFAMASAPPGWLKCNGSAVSRTTYAKLFQAVGTLFGAGDGATTFNIPDQRGEFLRGWDDGRGLDANRALGSRQMGQIESHTHAGSTAGAGYHSHGGSTDVQGHHGHSGSTDAQGVHTHSGTTLAGGSHSHATNTLGNNKDFTPGWIAAGGAASFPPGTTAAAGEHQHYLAIDWAGSHAHNLSINGAGEHGHNLQISAVADHSHGVSIAPTGGNETRPVNSAMLFCIKY